MLNEIMENFDIYRAETKSIVKKIATSLAPCKTILDAGAGDQRYKKYFTKHRYMAVDFVKVDKIYTKPDIICDLMNIPLPDRSVDIIICTWVLEHLKEPEKVLVEFKRVLKDGGAIHLTAPQNSHEHEIPYDYLRYTRYWFTYMGEKLSFNTMLVDEIGSYFHVLSHILFLLPQTLVDSKTNRISKLIRYTLYIFIIPVAEFVKLFSFLDKKKHLLLGYYVTYVK